MSTPDVPVHTLAAGTPGAPLVVLAHGLESGWASWLPMAVGLHPDWRVVALDLPWRPGNDYRWRTRSAGQILGGALDALGASPDLLVAHSFGANATLELICARDPRPGGRVVLICPMYRPPQHAVTWQMFDRARRLFNEHMREGLRARMGARADRVPPDVLRSMMDGAIDRVGPLGFLTTFQQFTASTDLELDRVEVDTLLVGGTADPTLTPDAAHLMAARMPRAAVRVTPGHDHFCHVKHAPAVAGEVLRFATSAGTGDMILEGHR